MTPATLPLFPLNVVLYPGGLLPLKIFEVRYLDMVTSCYKQGIPFGVVAMGEFSGQRAGDQADLPFARVGTMASILAFDVPHPGLIHIQTQGQQRFRVDSATQREDGLWLGQVQPVAADLNMPVPDDLILAVDSLRQLITNLQQQDIPASEMPLLPPYQFDDCGWVANRWCELLDLPLQHKLRMMALDSPLLRLELVNDLFQSPQD